MPRHPHTPANPGSHAPGANASPSDDAAEPGRPDRDQLPEPPAKRRPMGREARLGAQLKANLARRKASGGTGGEAGG